MKTNSALGLVLVLIVLSLALAVQADVLRSVPLSERIVSAGEVEYIRGEILVKFKTDISDRTMTELYNETGTEVLSVHRGGVKLLRVPVGVDEQTMVSRLQGDPRVEYAELNSVCHAHMTPNDPYYPYQWHFPKINMPQAWDISTGSSVIVAILDSGIAYENYTVPSYERGTVASGVTQYQVAPELNGTSFTAGYDFINNDSHPNDNDAHGTHVAGTIAQVTNNSQGVAGMAFDCTLMPVKVLDYSGSGTAQSLADGLYWAADHGAQVINMSLGWAPGYNPGSTVSNAIAYAYNHGVVLLASSGNSGVSPVSYPAAYSQVIAVGATRYDDARPSYSQYGSALEICAPGGDIGVDQNGDGYGDGVLQMTFTGYNPGPPEQLADPTDFGYWFYDGTSMACPHATALVAMMIANGQTGIENIRTILHETAVDLGSAGWDQYYGYGRIDAYAALTYGGQPPVAQFTGSPTSGCEPLTVNFTDQSTGEIDTWSWTFGDGGTSTAQNPPHQYVNAGDYTVSLTVTNGYGSDTESKTGYIHVGEAPVAAFVGSPTSGCAPLTVNFTDQSTGDISTWSWTFGDGGTSTAPNPSHQYWVPGDYTVTLNVSGTCGSDGETKTGYIHVDETLIAAFSGTPTSGCVPLDVGFTDESVGNITSWAWTFGDGGTSAAQNPSHQYAAPGDYTVTLTVTGACGSDAEAKTDYIHVDGAPVAGFYGVPTSGSAPLTVDFYDQSTGQVTFWDWTFGDGGTSTAQNPSHQYMSEGDYTVTLTVSGPCGSDGYTRTGYIHVEPPSEWTVITYDDFEGGFGTYTDGGSDCALYTGGTYAHQGSNAADIQDNSGTASSFYHTAGYDVSVYTELEVDFWFYAVSMDNSNEDFWVQYYDGSTWRTVATYAQGIDFQNNVFYHEVVTISSSQYDFPANAKLRFMCDASGNSDDVYIDEIEFRGKAGIPVPPVAAFIGAPTSGYAPLTVDFTDQSTGNPTGWSWTFGDGGTSSAENPTHEYTGAGSYTVSLTVTNAAGSDDEVKPDYITVTIEPPVAAFVGEPTYGVVPLTVDFTDQSTGPIDTWAWDFGDGVGTSSAQNPTYEYTEIGDYTLTLTVTGPGGTDSEIKSDYISVTGGGEWVTITYDDFEGGFGTYTDGGSDCALYTGGTYAHQGSRAADIQDNSGTASSFYHTAGHNVSAYTELEVDFWFYAVSMDNSNEDFWVQYYDGSTWRTVATYAQGIDFQNNVFYHEVVTISSSQYNFPTNARLRFMCDASNNLDDVYIDEIEFRGMAGGGSARDVAILDTRPAAILPESFRVSDSRPNPFSSMTEFTISLPRPDGVTAEIFNLQGQKVATLADRQMDAGTYTLRWDGTNQAGSKAASGIYYYRVVAGGNVVTKKMILAR
jgi:PKD repeat protein